MSKEFRFIVTVTMSHDVDVDAVRDAVNDTIGDGVFVFGEDGDLLSALDGWSVGVAPEATTEPAP